MAEKEQLVYNSTEQELYFKGERLQFAGVQHYILQQKGHTMRVEE